MPSPATGTDPRKGFHHVNHKIIDGLNALAAGAAVGYHRLEGVTIRVTSGGFLTDEVDAWRDGDPAPAYLGRLEPGGGLGEFRVMTATGKPHNKTDVLRQHSTGLAYVDALAALVGHHSQRPVKQRWDEAAAAAARAAVEPTAEPGTEEELVLLPHSGLRVPHTRLAVTSLKQLQTSRGVAFTATLRLDGRVVGTIEDQGNGGGPMFEPRHGAGFGHAEFAAFATRCRTSWGGNDVESVLGDLVDEYDTGRIVARNAKAGKLSLRLMSPITEGSADLYCADLATYPSPRVPRTDAERAALGQSCQRHTATGPGQTWQVWDADTAQWIDLPGPATPTEVTR